MDPTFGARLRLQRERREIPLAAIAERTKIKQSLLEALERDDLSHWPRGIFRRSYVRTYAQAIGLDPDRTLREFLELHPDQVEDIPDIVEARETGGGAAGRRPPTRLRFLIDSAMNALPALGVQGSSTPSSSSSRSPSAPDASFSPPPSPGSSRTAAADASWRQASASATPAATAARGDSVPTSRSEPAPVDATPPCPGSDDSTRPGCVNEFAIDAPEASLYGSSMTLVAVEYADDYAAPHPHPAAGVEETFEADPTTHEDPPAEGVAEHLDAAVPAPHPVVPPASSRDVDFPALAHLCTRLGCASDVADVTAVLADAAALLDAAGLVLWMVDDEDGTLAPAIAHGYGDQLLSQLPRVPVDTDNAIAVAFRTANTCLVRGTGHLNGALVAPLLTSTGCAGALALELRGGAERRDGVQASAALLAAQLASLLGPARAAAARAHA